MMSVHLPTNIGARLNPYSFAVWLIANHDTDLEVRDIQVDKIAEANGEKRTSRFNAGEIAISGS